MGNQTVDGPHSLPYYEVEDQNSIKLSSLHSNKCRNLKWLRRLKQTSNWMSYRSHCTIKLINYQLTPAVNKQNHRSEEKHIA